MANLLVLALAFTALVAFAYARPDNHHHHHSDNGYLPPFPYAISQVDVCQLYLQQSIQSSSYENYEPSQSLKELCCRQLQNMDEQYQCEGVKLAFQGALQTQGQQAGGQQIGQLMQKAQQLPNQCNLQLKGQCQIGSIVQTVITTTTVTNDQVEFYTHRRSSPRSQQQCSEVQGRQFNQCQRYIQQQQQQSGSVLLMRFNRQQGQQEPQELKSCCNELENVQRECHCDAIQEVYDQALRQQQGGKKQSGMEAQMVVQKAIQNLKNECNLQVQQCNIPSAMF